MTKEQAIEKCKKIINTNNKVVKEARKVRDINTMNLVASLDDESIAIETVLNMLKEKDAEIQFQKDINKTEKDRHKQTERSLKGQIWKKDKMIDLMAEYIDENDTSLANYLYRKNGKCNKEMIKQYFERKATNDG